MTDPNEIKSAQHFFSQDDNDNDDEKEGIVEADDTTDGSLLVPPKPSIVSTSTPPATATATTRISSGIITATTAPSSTTNNHGKNNRDVTKKTMMEAIVADGGYAGIMDDTKAALTNRIQTGTNYKPVNIGRMVVQSSLQQQEQQQQSLPVVPVVPPTLLPTAVVAPKPPPTEISTTTVLSEVSTKTERIETSWLNDTQKEEEERSKSKQVYKTSLGLEQVQELPKTDNATTTATTTTTTTRSTATAATTNCKGDQVHSIGTTTTKEVSQPVSFSSSTFSKGFKTSSSVHEKKQKTKKNHKKNNKMSGLAEIQELEQHNHHHVPTNIKEEKDDDDEEENDSVTLHAALFETRNSKNMDGMMPTSLVTVMDSKNSSANEETSSSSSSSTTTTTTTSTAIHVLDSHINTEYVQVRNESVGKEFSVASPDIVEAVDEIIIVLPSSSPPPAEEEEDELMSNRIHIETKTKPVVAHTNTFIVKQQNKAQKENNTASVNQIAKENLGEKEDDKDDDEMRDLPLLVKEEVTVKKSTLQDNNVELVIKEDSHKAMLDLKAMDESLTVPETKIFNSDKGENKHESKTVLSNNVVVPTAATQDQKQVQQEAIMEPLPPISNDDAINTVSITETTTTASVDASAATKSTTFTTTTTASALRSKSNNALSNLFLVPNINIMPRIDIPKAELNENNVKVLTKVAKSGVANLARFGLICTQGVSELVAETFGDLNSTTLEDSETTYAQACDKIGTSAMGLVGLGLVLGGAAWDGVVAVASQVAAATTKEHSSQPFQKVRLNPINSLSTSVYENDELPSSSSESRRPQWLPYFLDLVDDEIEK